MNKPQFVDLLLTIDGVFSAKFAQQADSCFFAGILRFSPEEAEYHDVPFSPSGFLVFHVFVTGVFPGDLKDITEKFQTLIGYPLTVFRVDSHEVSDSFWRITLLYPINHIVGNWPEEPDELLSFFE